MAADFDSTGDTHRSQACANTCPDPDTHTHVCAECNSHACTDPDTDTGCNANSASNARPYTDTTARSDSLAEGT